MLDRQSWTAICALAVCAAFVCSTVADNVKMGEFTKVLSTDVDDPPGMAAAWAIAVASLGDLDGEGGSAHAVAIGAPGLEENGAVWIVFLDEAGGVVATNRIDDEIEPPTNFGRSLAFLGDLDGDGPSAVAIAVGDDADDPDDGAAATGAIWVLFLDDAGAVMSRTELSKDQGIPLSDNDHFGVSVSALGNLDGGVQGPFALAVGASGDDGTAEPEANRGAVWILFLDVIDDNGTPLVTLVDHQRIGDGGDNGGFTGSLGDQHIFGESVEALGDLDVDGLMELAVGAPGDPNGDDRWSGTVWILSLDREGNVAQHVKISDNQAGFDATRSMLGYSLAALGDLDDEQPGVMSLATGNSTGAWWVLHLDSDGHVVSQREFAPGQCGVAKGIGVGDNFAHDIDLLENLDGTKDVLIGAPGDDEAESSNGTANNLGAFYVVSLEPVPDCPADDKGNCSVDTTDLLDLLAAWGTPDKDIDGDGITGTTDLLILLGAWGDCPCE